MDRSESRPLFIRTLVNGRRIADNANSLAYAEIELVLTNILFNFDLELVDERGNWLEQDSYILWVKEPLMVKVKSAGRR